MEIRVYKELPVDAVDIRNEVFVDEQGFNEEFDDADKKAIHIVGFIDGKSVATSRIIRQGGRFMIGRIAVRKAWRGCAYGAMIVDAAEKIIKSLGGKEIFIHSQAQAEGFYSQIGYTPTGERDFEEGCPHIMMKKEI